MKKLIVFIFLIAFFIGLKAQEATLGLIAGASYYNGELNPRSVLYMPGISAGVIYKHNFDYRWSLRIGVNYSKLKGNDANSSNTYQQIRNHSFNTQVWDLGPQVEFNFMRYNPKELNAYYFSPYLTTGILVAVIPDSYTTFQFSIPIGFGFKYALTNTVTAGLEWAYHWTNSDDIDNLLPDNFILSPSNQMSYNPDTDWYSFLGAHISVRVFKEKSTCPTFSY